jgi:perosamine synthetase|tara:strand:- start:1247 stop:2332 length:1086 start_codon:yes stop_codon:yes gene_type:complete
MQIPIYKPYIPKKSIEYSSKAIASGWISSLGEYNDLATNKLAELCKVKYALLTNNGTSATHLVSACLNKFNPNLKKVIVPAACYVAAYNSLLYEKKNWQLESADLDSETWNTNNDNLKVDKNTAILVVHNLGNIINVPKLIKKYSCPIVEDNCEGFLGSYNGTPSGSASLCSSLSFFANKNVTTGEGGAFLTNDKNYYQYALRLRGQGQTSKRYIHDVMGYNYRMTNIQAALLLGQLEEIDYIREEKRRVFDRYKNNLSNKSLIKLQRNEEGTSHSKWMLGVKFSNKNFTEAECFFDKAGIEIRPMFYPYKTHKYLSVEGDSIVAEKICPRIIIFPSFPTLKNSEIDFISEKILQFSLLNK